MSRLGKHTPQVLAAMEGKHLPPGREFLGKGGGSQELLPQGCPFEGRWSALSPLAMTRPVSPPSNDDNGPQLYFLCQVRRRLVHLEAGRGRPPPRPFSPSCGRSAGGEVRGEVGLQLSTEHHG